MGNLQCSQSYQLQRKHHDQSSRRHRNSKNNSTTQSNNDSMIQHDNPTVNQLTGRRHAAMVIFIDSFNPFNSKNS